MKLTLQLSPSSLFHSLNFPVSEMPPPPGWIVERCAFGGNGRWSSGSPCRCPTGLPKSPATHRGAAAGTAGEEGGGGQSPRTPLRSLLSLCVAVLVPQWVIPAPTCMSPPSLLLVACRPSSMVFQALRKKMHYLYHGIVPPDTVQGGSITRNLSRNLHNFPAFSAIAPHFFRNFFPSRCFPA